MKNLSKIFLLFLFSFSTIKPNYYSEIENKYPYLCYNIETISAILGGTLYLMINLNNKQDFKTPSENTVNEIKDIAKALKISKEKINNLKIKKPKKNSRMGELFENNYVSFLNTIIIGRQTEDELKEATTDKDVRKFIYGHELSHYKNNHSLKTLFYFVATPIFIELGARCLNYITQKSIDLINSKDQSCMFLSSTNNFNAIKALEIIKNITNLALTKIFMHAFLMLSISKKFEWQADAGASSLGQDAINGGIKYLETVKKVGKDKDNSVIESFDNKFLKQAVKLILCTKNFLLKTFNTHPTTDNRIASLKKLLPKTA